MSQKQSRVSKSAFTAQILLWPNSFSYSPPSQEDSWVCHELFFLNLVLAFSVYQSDRLTPFALLSLLKVFPLKL